MRSEILPERVEEMRRYGRLEAYEEIHKLLSGDMLTGFDLVNNVLAVVDDIVDETGDVGMLHKAAEILKKHFAGETTEKTEDWQKDVADLGEILRILKQTGFSHARDIYDEVLNFWQADIKDKERKGIVLDGATLDKTNEALGRPIAAQFLYFLAPQLSSDEITELASKYGLAVKLADNLSDLERDTVKGLTSIPLESRSEPLDAYRRAEMGRVEEAYRAADTALENVVEQHSELEKGLSLFRSIVHSWLLEAREKTAAL